MSDRHGCDAARRNKQALYAMELDWGAGTFDIGKLKAILNGDCQDCETTTDPDGSIFYAQIGDT